MPATPAEHLLCLMFSGTTHMKTVHITIYRRTTTHVHFSGVICNNIFHCAASFFLNISPFAHIKFPIGI